MQMRQGQMYPAMSIDEYRQSMMKELGNKVDGLSRINYPQVEGQNMPAYGIPDVGSLQDVRFPEYIPKGDLPNLKYPEIEGLSLPSMKIPEMMNRGLLEGNIRQPNLGDYQIPSMKMPSIETLERDSQLRYPDLNESKFGDLMKGMDYYKGMKHPSMEGGFKMPEMGSMEGMDMDKFRGMMDLSGMNLNEFNSQMKMPPMQEYGQRHHYHQRGGDMRSRMMNQEYDKPYRFHSNLINMDKSEKLRALKLVNNQPIDRAPGSLDPYDEYVE